MLDLFKNIKVVDSKEGDNSNSEIPERNSINIRDEVLEAIKTVYDPEIPVNIYELGLIYDVQYEDGKVHILMTLTSPGCPAAGMLPGEVEEKAKSVPGVKEATVEITFEPPWDQSMMSDEAKLELGFM